MERINTHNAIPDSGFELEVNKFADMSDEEFIQKQTGLRVPKGQTAKMQGGSVAIEDTE